jgi:hypothetical protein
MTTSIRNCVFAFKCTKAWDGLTETADPGVRYCGDCQREVHFCENPWELAQAVALNRCVAIVVEDHLGGVGAPLIGEVIETGVPAYDKPLPGDSTQSGS